MWRNAGFGRGVRPVEALAFLTGWVALMVALSPLLDEWSEQWQAAHMVQHELLMVVAAPLIAVGAPLVGILWAMPLRLRLAVVGVVQHTPLPGIWRTIDAPAVAFFLYGVALWIWHIPALYDAALEHEAVHIVQHLCFFGTAALFWWGIVHGRQGRLGYGAAVVYLFVTAVHSGVLGALLTVSPRVWYAPYLAHHPAALTPLEDQQLAGLVMWIPAGLAFAAGALFLFAGVAATVRPGVTFSIAAARAVYGYSMSTRACPRRRRAGAVVAARRRAGGRPIFLAAAVVRNRPAFLAPRRRYISCLRGLQRRVADACRRLRQSSLQHARHHQDDERHEPPRRHDVLDRRTAWP